MIEDVIYYWRGQYNHGHDGPRPHDFVIEKPSYIFIYDDYYDIEDHKIPILDVLNRSPAAKESLLFFTGHTNPKLDFANYSAHSMIHTGLAGMNTVGLDLRKGALTDNLEMVRLNKSQPFNFIVNKPRIHRIILLLLLKHFNLQTGSYSFTWPNTAFDNAAVEKLITASNLKDKHDIDWSSISYKNKKFLNDSDQYCGNFLIERDSGIKSVYNDYLNTIYRDSYVSLIQEPNFESLSTQITEKTYFPIINQNLLIWPGGYRQASEIESLGFDVFRDIVDHSYELNTDPVSRIYYAIKNNLHILSDTSITEKFYIENHHRFVKNCEILTDISQLKKKMFKEFSPIVDPVHREIQLKLADSVVFQDAWNKYAHVRKFHQTGYQVTSIYRLLDL